MTLRIFLLTIAILGCTAARAESVLPAFEASSPASAEPSAAAPAAPAAGESAPAAPALLTPSTASVPSTLPRRDSAAPARAGVPQAGEAKLPVVELETPAAQPQTIDLTHEAPDLFQRLRNGFSMPDINNDLVLSHQQWYLNRPDYLRRMVERSSLYLYHILEELEKRGMPTELALLPMVESAYNPMALSRAKASGLWQFIPATGKRYKLEQNWWLDERRDIVASTSAALDYLESIYEMHGDWQLALASYNWGESAVGRAIGKNQALGLPTDYQSLTMPRETKNYVPKLQALKNIFSDPALVAELSLRPIPNRPYFATVTKGSNIDVKVAAKLAGMPVNEFVALNPAHNRPVIKSDTPMVIPADKMDAFESNLEAHEERKQPLSSWRAYTLRPGDKLEKIAPRFGMTVANLKSVNGIQGKIRVAPGLTLLVPGKGDDLPLDALPLSQPEISAAPPARSEVRTHIVARGETLATIARRFDLSLAELQRINHLRGSAVKPGTRLIVSSAGNGTKAPGEASKAAKVEKVEKAQKAGKLAKVPETSAGAKPRAASAASPPAPAARRAPKIAHHTVRSGETLASIARRYKVGVDDLRRWNPVSTSALKPGTQLTIQLAQNP